MNRIGELFMLGFHGPQIPSWLKIFAEQFGLGGVILFDYYVQTKKYENNVYSPSQVKELCAEIHELPSRPLVFVDQEGGKVRRFKEKLGFAPFPSQQKFNELAQEEKQRILEAVFAELHELGIDVNLTPVVDINSNPSNPDIGAVERSYSSLAQEVRENARIVAAVANKYRVHLTLKHFPGLGGATVNSHLELTDLSNAVSDEQLEVFRDLLPLLPSKAMIMSHGIVRQWDSRPVSLSAHAVKMVRAWEPNAFLITDDLQMMGLQKILPTQSACIEALRAGMDMFCIGNNLLNEEGDCLKIVETLKSAVAQDHGLAENCQNSLSRISKIKKLI